ncbi:MAG: helix-turn-helix domain-containing protein [Acidobacteriota bacterium]
MGSLGQNLLEMREERGKTLEEVSSLSGLNIRALSALENGEFNFFRGNFYFINYLKSYLDFLEVDHERFFSRFEGEINLIKEVKKEPGKIYFSGIKYSKFSRRGVLIKVIIFLIVFAGIFYAGFYKKGFKFDFLSSAKEVSLPGTGIGYDFSRFSEHDFSPLELKIKFKGKCWVQLFRGNKKVIEKVFSDGETILESGYELLLLMGNPSAADIFINKIKITRFAESPESIKLRINPMNMESFY